MSNEADNGFGNQYYESMQYKNSGAIDSESLKIRLVTRDVLDQIKTFLEGKRLVEYIENVKENVLNDAGEKVGENIVGQEIRVKEISIGKPKANKEGIQYLMFWLESKFNSQMALGNISEEQYAKYLEHCHVSLVENLIINKYHYGLTTSNIREIMSVLMEALEVYMSRPIKAGDRNSLTMAVRTIDSHTTTPSQRKKVFGIF